MWRSSDSSLPWCDSRVHILYSQANDPPLLNLGKQSIILTSHEHGVRVMAFEGRSETMGTTPQAIEVWFWLQITGKVSLWGPGIWSSCYSTRVFCPPTMWWAHGTLPCLATPRNVPSRLTRWSCTFAWSEAMMVRGASSFCAVSFCVSQGGLRNLWIREVENQKQLDSV